MKKFIEAIGLKKRIPLRSCNQLWLNRHRLSKADWQAQIDLRIPIRNEEQDPVFKKLIQIQINFIQEMINEL